MPLYRNTGACLRNAEIMRYTKTSSVAVYQYAQIQVCQHSHLHSFPHPNPHLHSQRRWLNQQKPNLYWAHTVTRVYELAHFDDMKKKFSHLNVYSNDSLQIWKKAFDDCDRDGDGLLSQADLQKSMNLSHEKAILVKNYDLDKNNAIDFGEYVEAMYNVDMIMLLKDFKGFDPVDVQLEFDKFCSYDDTYSQKIINIDGVKRMMAGHEFTVVTDEDAERLTRDMDINKDGVVTFDDFKIWIQGKEE